MRQGGVRRSIRRSAFRWLATATLAVTGAVTVTARAEAETVHCTHTNAVSTTIEAIQAAAARWDGRCVRITGIAFAGRLYANRAARREPLNEDGNAKRSLVFLSSQAPARRGARLEIIGRVQDCRRANESVLAMMKADPTQFVMVGGYCHTSMEVTVMATNIRRAP